MKLKPISNDLNPWTTETDEELISILESQTEHPVKIINHIQKIKDLFKRVYANTYQGIPYNRPTIDDILHQAYSKYQVTAEAIKGPSRSQQLLQARGWICTQLYVAGYTFAEIARAIDKHQSTIKYTLEREGIINNTKTLTRKYSL